MEGKSTGRKTLIKDLKECLAKLKNRIEPGHLICFKCDGHEYFATVDSIVYLEDIYVKLIGGEEMNDHNLKYCYIMIRSVDNIVGRSERTNVRQKAKL